MENFVTLFFTDRGGTLVNNTHVFTLTLLREFFLLLLIGRLFSEFSS